MKFAWTRRGKNGWTDEQVELLLVEQEKHIVRDEVGPLKDKVKDLSESSKTELAKLEAEKKEIAKKLEDMTTELVPVRKAQRLNKISEMNKKAKIISEDKLSDALILSGISDEDDMKAVTTKLTEFVSKEERKSWKFVETDDSKKLEEEKLQAQKLELEKRLKDQNSENSSQIIAAMQNKINDVNGKGDDKKEDTLKNTSTPSPLFKTV